MGFRNRWLVCLWLMLMLLPTLTHATQFEYRSPRQLGEQATLVVRGRVQSVESYWNAKHTKIFTRTRIAVDETYKGDHEPTVDVIQLGGVVGNVRVTVHGALGWKVGEEVLLFAEPYDPGTYRVSGFSQGKFEIWRDRTTDAAYIHAPRIEGVRILGVPSAERQARVRAPQGVPLDEFVSHALGRPIAPGVAE